MSPRRAREGQPSEYKGNGSLSGAQAPRVRRCRRSAPGADIAARAPTRARQRAPEAMSAHERLRELGALLARGVARLRLRQKALAESGETEAASGPVVNGKENATGESHE